MAKQLFARMAAAVMIVAAGLLGTVATAQNRAISGTVVDESGVPVVGADIPEAGGIFLGGQGQEKRYQEGQKCFFYFSFFERQVAIFPFKNGSLLLKIRQIGAPDSIIP